MHLETELSLMALRFGSIGLLAYERVDCSTFFVMRGTIQHDIDRLLASALRAVPDVSEEDNSQINNNVSQNHDLYRSEFMTTAVWNNSAIPSVHFDSY